MAAPLLADYLSRVGKFGSIFDADFALCCSYLEEVDRQIGETIASAWSTNTKSTRSSQWRIYIDFCHQNGLNPVPATVY